MSQKVLIRSLFVLYLGVMLLSVSAVFAADLPSIVVAPIWRPASTLDSIDLLTPNVLDAGDDFRYVDVDLFVTSNVQFWAAQITCTVTPTVLTTYSDPALDDGDPNNSVPAVTWGTIWGQSGTDYTAIVDPYIATTGTRTITATRLGTRQPLGENNRPSTMLLATLRYRAKDLPKNAPAPLVCTTAFFNQNATPVLTPTYVAPAPLQVITGYTLSGMVLYQGRIAHTGIEVVCDGPNASSFTAVTNAKGEWSYLTRAQGIYQCDYMGNTVTPLLPGYQPDRYLVTRTRIVVTGASYTALPTMLSAGNVDITGDPASKDETIAMSDLNAITAPSSWNKPVTTGDANGDGKTDRLDLILTAGNIVSSETQLKPHILGSFARDLNYFSHNQLWLGTIKRREVTSFVAPLAGNARDLWPTVSPDGKTLAFTRQTQSTMAALYTAPIVAGVVGTPVRITPTTQTYNAYAPSWSPDGTRLAFICEYPKTVSGVILGAAVDAGTLCIIDATGRNYQAVALRDQSHIFPPAWISTTEIIYGGALPNADNPQTVCAGTLCYLDLLKGTTAARFDDDIVPVSGSPFQYSDMPIYRQGRLFYRYSYGTVGSVVRRLHYADIARDSNKVPVVSVFQINPMLVSYPVHIPVSRVDFNLLPMSSDVDYYTVSRDGLSLLFYTSSAQTVSFASPIALSVPFEAYYWPSIDTYSINDFVVNPAGPLTPNNSTDANDPTDLYAYRTTFEWLP